MATITPTLMLSLKGKDNTFPIYFSISMGKGKRKFENSKIRIKKNEWDIKKKQVINHPNSVAYNLYIKNRITNFEKETVFKQDNELYALLTEKKQNILLCEFILNMIEKNNQKKATRYKHLAVLNKLKKCNDILSLPLSQLTSDIILKVQKQWIIENLDTNSILQYIEIWSCYMNMAYKQKLIAENPFKNDVLKKMLVKSHSTERIFLTKEEVSLFINKYDSLKKEEQLYAGYFLISCFTGLRASDVTSLNIKSILKEKSVGLKTQKTGEQLRIPLTEDILRIISAMQKNPYNKHDVSYFNYYTNIKSIAKKIGVKKHITTHVARHTFAMRLAEMGVSIEIAQRLLGHTDIKTTSIYYKIGNKRINDEMSKFGYS